MLCSLHLANRKVHDGNLDRNIAWKSSNIFKYIYVIN
jgi:hypothetical protein